MINKVTALVLLTSIILSSCATVLNGRYQKAKVITNSAKAKVYVDGTLAGTGKVVPVKLKRNYEIRQFKVEADGYKPEYSTGIQTKKSPLYIMSWVPFAVFFFYPPMLDKGPKSRNYDKEFSISPKVKTVSKGANEKYLYLKATAFDVKKEDFIFEKYSLARYKKNKKSKNVENSEEKVDISNSVFTDALNDVLKKNNFIDTTSKVLRNKTNTMYLGAKVNKIKMKYVTSPNRTASGYTIAISGYWVAELTAEWTMMDIYEQPKYAKTIVSQSGQLASNYDFSKGEYNRAFLYTAIEDALTTSFYSFLNDQSARNLLALDTKKATFDPLKILSPTKTTSLKNARSSTVTISVKNGHGSGCLISDKGYVVTNYHVVAGNTNVEVILGDGSKYQATVVRSNDELDLALLLIQNAPQGLNYFDLPKTVGFEVGDEVFAIGTPKSIELNQTLSKGIISGLRKLPDNSQLIQTDVSVNVGNSGGSLVSKDGQLYGIVNSKLVGQGVEGIAFCIPANDIAKALGLE